MARLPDGRSGASGTLTRMLSPNSFRSAPVPSRAWILILALALLAGCRGEPAAPEQAGPGGDGAGAGESLATLEAAVSASPGDVDLRLRLARRLEEAERRDEAIEHLREASVLRPDAATLFQLAVTLAAASRLQEAEAAYRRVLELSPDNPVVLHNMGTVALGLDKPEQAVSYYERAVALRPGYLLAHYNLAGIYKFNGRYAEAYAAYQRAAQLTPADTRDQNARVDALYQLADLELLRGEPERAEKLLAQFLQIVPDHPTAHYTRAQALIQLGRPEEADAELAIHMEHLSQRQPSSPAATGRR